MQINQTQRAQSRTNKNKPNAHRNRKGQIIVALD